MKKKLAVIAITTSIFLAACGNKESSTNEKAGDNGADTLKVYTTIYPFQYFTERVGGEYVSVENIVPPGSDAHTVEVKTKEMMELAEGDAFIYSGTGLEPFADAVIDAVENEEVQVVKVTENVDFIDAKEDAHEEEGNEQSDTEEESVEEHGSEPDVDPHVWLDPSRSIIMAQNIKNALVQIDPDNKKAFEENFTALKKDLEALDADFKEMAETAENETFLVSHSAYGYWDDAYGLQQIAITGLSPTDEPSQSELVEIIDLVNKDDLKYIYFEPNLTNKIAETVQKETGTKTLTLYNLESLTKENIESGEDYLSVMKKNIEALDQGFSE
ncbi:metal ABC transporter substrate-binding protein [Domibacillus robiginosus]|uniref:metal ABC transporter substrate-binding protein n=1 Tax=Domibacillus robiginosus TaxID=1071054 RepID=UPI00067D5AD9|nr:metal ABC transporter substrate-binding protein [Domibacillus robiginosus]